MDKAIPTASMEMLLTHAIGLYGPWRFRRIGIGLSRTAVWSRGFNHHVSSVGWQRWQVGWLLVYWWTTGT